MENTKNVEPSSKKNGFREKLDKFFHISERGSKISTEIIGGIITFMAMAYILMVNANMFADPFADGTNVLGVSYGAIYIATALAAVIGTLLIGLLANLPLAQASGMGLNAFFVYTMCITAGLTYQNALVLVLIEGVVFIILTVTGLRKKIFDAIPLPVRKAIPAGIGLFIAFLGLQSAGIVVSDDSTLVNLVSFNILGGASWATLMPVVITILTLFAIGVLSKLKVRGGMLWAILGGTALYYLLGLTIPDFYSSINVDFNILNYFKEWGTQSFGQVFTNGFNFSGYLADHDAGSLVLLIITSSLAFCLVDMFDTLGTLYGACSRGNLLDEKGDVPNMKKAMLADALATTVGSVLGTSTVTTFVESSSGVGEGARTGFASVVTAALFFVSMFLAPIASLIPGATTAAALVYVGVLMMAGVKDIDWNDPEIALPSFLTMVIMPFTYNVSYGISFGIISYIVIKLFQGKFKEINIWTYVIAALFLVMFLLTH